MTNPEKIVEIDGNTYKLANKEPKVLIRNGAEYIKLTAKELIQKMMENKI